MTCAVRSTLVPFVGLVVEGSCGERLELGVSQVLRPEDLPRGACEEFRERVLQAFGPKGSRVFEREEAFTGFRTDGTRGLGKRPESQLEDRELAAMFGRRPEG